MRSRIVEEVVRRGPAELAAKARALIPRTGNLAQQLLELGYPSSAILDGASAATGVKPAAPGWLREPAPPPLDYDDGLLFRAAHAAPVATEGGALCVAYADPEVAADAANQGLPPHRAYLAMPAQLARALALLPSEPTITESKPHQATRRAAWATPSEAPRPATSPEQRLVNEALDAALDDDEGPSEATRTVPGGAPPALSSRTAPGGPPPAAAAPEPGPSDVADTDSMTVAASLEQLRRVAQLSSPGAPAGPGSREDASFEDIRTQQVDLVSPAARAAVEPTVTAATASPPAPAIKPASASLALDEAETIAMNQRQLRDMVATQRMPKNLGAARKSLLSEENPFDDPTEHVDVLTSREMLAAAKNPPKKPAAAPATEPTPPPRVATPPPAPVPTTPRAALATPAPPTPVPPAPAPARPAPSAPAPAAPRTPAPQRAPAPRTQVEDPPAPRPLTARPPHAHGPDHGADEGLGSTQPMPRHQPTTEGEVVPVPVARRGASPLASALSTVGLPVMEEPSAKVRSSERGARRIPGFDDAEPAPAAPERRVIPGFDDPEPSSSKPAARKGRMVMLHPPDDRHEAAVARLAQQETEAEPPAPGPEPLDPAALQPVPLDPADLIAAEPDPPAPPASSPTPASSALDFFGEREADFSRPPLPSPLPPRPSAPRASPRSAPVEEPEHRSPPRRGAAAGGLQVLRAANASSGAPVPEAVDERPRDRAPPMIPGIDSPMPSDGRWAAGAEASEDGRTKQILVAAGLVAALIIAGAALVRMRQERGQSAVEVPSFPIGDVAPPAPAADLPPPLVGPEARQQALLDEARRAGDPTRALSLYSQALDQAPTSAAARDALFERAKLRLAVGDTTGAATDVAMLKRRDDTKGMERDLQLILDGATAARGAQ